MSPLPYKDTLRRPAVCWRRRITRSARRVWRAAASARRRSVLLIVMLLSSSPAWAQSSLPDLSLEELMSGAGQVTARQGADRSRAHSSFFIRRRYCRTLPHAGGSWGACAGCT